MREIKFANLPLFGKTKNNGVEVQYVFSLKT